LFGERGRNRTVNLLIKSLFWILPASLFRPLLAELAHNWHARTLCPAMCSVQPTRWYLDRNGTCQMTAPRRKTEPTKTPASRLTKVRLEALVAEATVDAYDESEQAVGFLTMIDEHLAIPFSTTILGVEVTVERVDVTESNEVVAVCRRARIRQRIPLLDLPLPTPPPTGAEWIEAYRYWRRGYR